MIGCASHRLNLAVNLLMDDHSSILGKVQTLMVKIKNSLLASAQLRRKTSLRPVLRQDTRWSSTFMMVHRYFEIKSYIEGMGADVVAMMPTRREEKQLEGLLTGLRVFKSTSKQLESGDNLTLLDVRDLFDALIEQEPRVAKYLAADASIVKNIAFESACVDVQLGREALLSTSDAEMLQPLLDSTTPPKATRVAEEVDGFATAALKEARRNREIRPRFKSAVDAIAPTSNVVERFFSQAKAILGLNRQSLTPLHLESILFLKVNRKYWNAATARKVVRGDM